MKRHPSTRPWYLDSNRFKSDPPLRAGRSNSKYRSIQTAYDGRVYHSGKEAAYARTLDALKKAYLPSERVLEWKPQVVVPLVVNGKTVCTYIADFEVRFADGRTEIHEVKGFETNVWLIKRKLFEACYPGRVLKVIR